MFPTLVGFIAVLAWGFSIPISRLIGEHIGGLVYILILYPSCGLVGLLIQVVKRKEFPETQIFRNKYFYLRGTFFILHETLIMSAVFLVSKRNLPLVILINYLWPTMIIICSILIAGVKVARWRWFVSGCVLVVSSIAYEILSPSEVSLNSVAQLNDCLAYVFAFVGAISWGLYSACTRRGASQSGQGEVVKFYQLAYLLGLPLLLVAPIPEHLDFNVLVVALLILNIGLNFLGFLCWDFGMRRGNVVILSLGADFIPWLSLAAIYLIHGIAIGWHTAISVVVLVIGAMVTRYGTLPNKKY